MLHKEFSTELGDKTMTIIEQERAEAKTEVVRNLLKENFDFKFISKITELPESSIREIKSQMSTHC